MERKKSLANVIVVSDYAYVNGGAARVALSSAVALAERGLNVQVFAAVGPTWDELTGAPNLRATCLDEKPYNSSSLKRSMFAGLWDRGAELAFDRLVKDCDPATTVVHFHSNRDALSSSVFEPVFKRRVPLIYTCHEYGVACPYSSFFDHKTDEICTRRALSASCLFAHCNRKGYDKKLWTFTKQAIQNRYLRLPSRIDDVIFVSEFSRRILEPYLGAGPRRHVVPNPVNAVRGQKRKLAPDSPFVFVGLLTPGKGPVQAAAAAARAGASIRFVGDGDAREAVMQANCNAVVTGWLSPEQVRRELLSARALVLPALWYETQGLVVQEAASVGLPAVVTRTSAASETISEGVNGLLVGPNSVEELAAAMRTLKDDQVACEMGKAAFARFWANPPSLELHVDRIAEIYQEALGSA